MFRGKCICRKGDKTPGAILRRAFKNKTAQPPRKDYRDHGAGGWAMSLRDPKPSPSDHIQVKPSTTHCKTPRPHRSAHLRGPTPGPVAPTSPKRLPNCPPHLQRQSLPHSPGGYGALPPSCRPTAQHKLSAARIRPHAILLGWIPPPWHSKLLLVRSFLCHSRLSPRALFLYPQGNRVVSFLFLLSFFFSI